MELSKITHADFEKCIDQEFSCSMGGGELRLVLAEVRVATAKRGFPESTRQPFSLFFKGAPEHYVPQSIYKLNNETLGETEIFIVPVDKDGQGRVTYQAVFS